MDKIFLHGIKADTLIGVYGWERERLQTLIVDLDIGV
ncbi:dihydroneopterin aldolase, partial [Klebsiella pneumoniae]|nr:dihydroneopterin aldolase [Klebsiella pneumoniae]